MKVCQPVHHFSSSLYNSDVFETTIFPRTEESHNETEPSLIGSFRPIKNEMPLPKVRSRVMARKSSPSCLTRVSRTSLNPENARRPSPRTSRSSPPFADKLDPIANLMSTSRREKRTDKSQRRSIPDWCSFHSWSHPWRTARGVLFHTAAHRYFSVSHGFCEREGFDGFLSLRFCGLIFEQNRRILGFFCNVNTNLVFFFLHFQSSLFFSADAYLREKDVSQNYTFPYYLYQYHIFFFTLLPLWIINIHILYNSRTRTEPEYTYRHRHR